MQNIFNSAFPRANVLACFTVQPIMMLWMQTVCYKKKVFLFTMVDELNQKKQAADDHDWKNIDLK